MSQHKNLWLLYHLVSCINKLVHKINYKYCKLVIHSVMQDNRYSLQGFVFQLIGVTTKACSLGLQQDTKHIEFQITISIKKGITLSCYS